ncbi:MAG TPA: type II secretion system major pseudopilin GspG [Steroidobacteraceae bacterium]|nr:type II secretion system major pseudopilin GspG [Steroidobacteraceae bacterium]
MHRKQDAFEVIRHGRFDCQQASGAAAARRHASPRAHRARGFTLIEIMVVVIIIGLLAAVIVPQVVNKVDEARVTKAKQDIQSLETALTMFRLDNSKYPTTDQGLTALIKQPTDPSIRHWRQGGYLERISKDPWGNDYQYVYPGTHGKEYDLYTLGADAQPGGEGVNADIGNWNIGDE